jgi:alpha-L-rhamnosidase
MLSLSLACSPAATADGLKIAAIGTSLTAQGGWQAPLQKEMAECLDVPVTVTNHARGGETSRWGLQNIDVILAERPDIVLIEFAVNDAALNRFISLSQSVENMRAIVRAVRAENSRAIIIIQAMNPLWGFRRWVRPFLDRYSKPMPHWRKSWGSISSITGPFGRHILMPR